MREDTNIHCENPNSETSSHNDSLMDDMLPTMNIATERPKATRVSTGRRRRVLFMRSGAFWKSGSMALEAGTTSYPSLFVRREDGLVEVICVGLGGGWRCAAPSGYDMDTVMLIRFSIPQYDGVKRGYEGEDVFREKWEQQ